MVQRNIDILSHSDANERVASAIEGAISDPDLGNHAELVFVPSVLEMENASATRGAEAPITMSAPPALGLVGEVSESDALASAPGGYELTVAGGFTDLDNDAPAILSQESAPSFDILTEGAGSLPRFQDDAPFASSSVIANTPGTTILSGTDPTAYDATASLSVSFWVRVSTLVNQMQLVGKGLNATGNAGWSVGMNFSGGTSGQLWVETEQPGNNGMGNSAYAQFTSSILAASTWRHVIVTLDFSPQPDSPPEFRCYVNGGALSGDPAGAVVTGTRVPDTAAGWEPTRNNPSGVPFSVFGGSGFYSGSTFASTIEMVDLTLWLNSVLTPADANALWNGGTVLPPNMVSGLSASPSGIYTLRNTRGGLDDVLGNLPRLTNSGCVDSTQFP